MKKNKLSSVDNWRVLAEQAGFKPAALAKSIEVSLARQERFFHGQIGRSPENWLNELRLRIAAQRLAAGLAIQDVVKELGTCDAIHWTTRDSGATSAVRGIAFVNQGANLRPDVGD